MNIISFLTARLSALKGSNRKKGARSQIVYQPTAALLAAFKKDMTYAELQKTRKS